MINYLTWDDIEVINNLVIKEGGQDEKSEIINPLFIPAIIDFIKNNFNDDVFKKALGYCISLIVLHPFSDGNHRTSLVMAERFLIKNSYYTNVTDHERKKLQKWRLNYGARNNLEQRFFSISNIEDINVRNEKIKEVMGNEYGVKIENWLKKNYKVKTNVPSHNI